MIGLFDWIERRVAAAMVNGVARGEALIQARIKAVDSGEESALALQLGLEAPDLDARIMPTLAAPTPAAPLQIGSEPAKVATPKPQRSAARAKGT